MWALLADYGNDPRWRRGVRTMDPRPAGLVAVGARTAEEPRFAGRAYDNDGEVVEVAQAPSVVRLVIQARQSVSNVR
ncbi:hypothetical protein [Nocardia sp. IFM 10818]